VKVYQDPDIVRQITLTGATIVTTTPEATAAFIKSEIAKWAKLVKESGATVD